jgi:uncharacterized repeat protein (TIGR03803 family)
MGNADLKALALCCFLAAGCLPVTNGSPPQELQHSNAGQRFSVVAQGSGSSISTRSLPELTYSLLYSFEGGNDGVNPQGALTFADGILYGTTSEGGSRYASQGFGTVFELDLSGTERVLHRFKGGEDGANPEASLLALDGTLYGTTAGGGAASSSSVGDKFYGTTYQGGEGNYGTVFEVSTSGQERVLYSFAAGTDGAYPLAGLIDVDGTLYGTTSGGGTGGVGPSSAGGTVYQISTSGTERVIYNFSQSSHVPYDGWEPTAGLLAVKRRLYGTTVVGGLDLDGTVFELSL